MPTRVQATHVFRPASRFSKEIVSARATSLPRSRNTYALEYRPPIA